MLDLKKGLQQGLTTTSIESDPELESLRKRPDYQALLNQYASRKKVGFRCASEILCPSTQSALIDIPGHVERVARRLRGG